MIRKTLRELGEILGGRVIGDHTLSITGIAGLTDAQSGDVSFILGEQYLHLLDQSRATAVIVPDSMTPPARDCVAVPSVEHAVEGAKRIFRPPIHLPRGIHPSVTLGENVSLGEDVTLMANVVVQDGAQIGDRVILYPGVYVGHRTQIGEDCLIYPNAVIREDVKMGARIIVHSGAVIGADGFGFVAGVIPHQKVAQVGEVVLGDDVEIGANTTIDRATLGSTKVECGTKLDNLVQVAHNVTVQRDCLISSQTGIAGSAIVGRNVILGGQVGVGDHVTIGDGVIVAAKSGVTKTVGPKQILYGNPAGSRGEKQREAVSIRKLPQLVKRVRELEQRLAELEQGSPQGESTS